MSVADIEDQIRDVYNFEVSTSTISRITSRIAEDIVSWQNRPLEPVYLIVWMDGIVFKVRENSRVVNKTVYIAVGLKQKWNSKYSYAIKSWRENWDELTVFFDFPLEIRQIIYTTNLIENLNGKIRKYT